MTVLVRFVHDVVLVLLKVSLTRPTHPSDPFELLVVHLALIQVHVCDCVILVTLIKFEGSSVARFDDNEVAAFVLGGFFLTFDGGCTFLELFQYFCRQMLDTFD